MFRTFTWANKEMNLVAFKESERGFVVAPKEGHHGEHKNETHFPETKRKAFRQL